MNKFVVFCFLFSSLAVVNTQTNAANSSAVEKVANQNLIDESLRLYQVTSDIYAIVGPLGNRSPKNLGNNATFGFVVTTEGVVLIDPGGTYKGAQKIHDIIKIKTKLPVKFVINTGGQDHRWLGNNYYQSLGAKVIASQDAVHDQKSRLKDILLTLSNTAGDEAMVNTIDTYADITFKSTYEFTLGGITFNLNHPSGAHSPGDTIVWIPQHKIAFTGDIVYTERLLSMMSFSDSKSWVNAYNVLATLKPKHIIPGHGKPTTMDIAQRDTYDYLTSLRSKVKQFMDNGGDIADVSQIDQSKYKYLSNYDLLKGRNVQKIYQEIEFE